MAGILFWTCLLAIFYVYAGYPLLVSLLARFRPQTPVFPEHLPGLTLIIAAYNEEKVMAAKLENCLNLDYPRNRLQILIAADGSSDRTVEIVHSFARQGIELSFSEQRRGKAAAINRAIKQARHEIVVFSDANNSYDSQALKHLARPFSDPGIGAVTGSKSLLKSESHLAQADNLYWRYESFLKTQETRIGCTVGVAGEILALRRSLFKPIPERIINDDFFLALKVISKGFRVIYVPEARSFEKASCNEKQEQVRRVRIVAGRYQAMLISLKILPLSRPLLLWQVFSHKFLRPLVPFFLIGALLANLAVLLFPVLHPPAWLFLAPPWALIFFVLQIVFYSMAMIGLFFKPRGLLGKIIYLPAFLVNSNYAALVGLLRYLTGNQTALWEKAAR